MRSRVWTARLNFWRRPKLRTGPRKFYRHSPYVADPFAGKGFAVIRRCLHLVLETRDKRGIGSNDQNSALIHSMIGLYTCSAAHVHGTVRYSIPPELFSSSDSPLTVASLASLHNKRRRYISPMQSAPAFTFSVPCLSPITYTSQARSPRRPATMSAPITFVTGNQNKLREVESILSTNNTSDLRVVARKLDLPELQGEPDDIAREKCLLATKQVAGPTVRALPNSFGNYAYPP